MGAGRPAPFSFSLELEHVRRLRRLVDHQHRVARAPNFDGGLTMLRSLFLTLALAFVCAMQFVPGVGVGEAYAQSADPCMSATTAVITCQTRENAWNRCTLKSSAVKAAHPTWSPACYYYSTGGGSYSCYIDHASGTGCGGYGGIGGGSSGIYWSATCAAGGSWQDSTKTCFSSAACLAKNDDLGLLKDQARPSLTTSRCVSGCEFAMSPQTTLTASGGGSSSYWGVMKYTGLACTVNPPAVPAGTEAEQQTAPKQECIQIAGQSTCLHSDGRYCVAGRTGREFCWRPGETGEKVDANTLQVRNSGTTPVTPTTPPPPGDTFTPTGPTVTSTVTVANGGFPISITSAVQNYTTSGGANAGGSAPDQGQNSDGSTGASPENSPSTGDKDSTGSVSGGDDCTTAPAVDGGNPLEASIIRQTWLSRCSGQADANIHVQIATDAVTADEAAFHDLSVEEIGDLYSSVADSHEASEVAGPGDASGVDGLDAGGFLGAGTCPVFEPIHVGPVLLPINFSPICDLLVSYGTLLLAFTYLLAARVIATS